MILSCLTFCNKKPRTCLVLRSTDIALTFLPPAAGSAKKNGKIGMSHKMWAQLSHNDVCEKNMDSFPKFQFDVWYLCRISFKDICTLLICCPRLSPGQSSERRYISVRKNPIFDGGRGPDVGGFVFLRCDPDVESSYCLSSQWCFSHHFHWDESMTCVFFLGTRVASRERWVYIYIYPTKREGNGKSWTQKNLTFSGRCEFLGGYLDVFPELPKICWWGWRHSATSSAAWKTLEVV